MDKDFNSSHAIRRKCRKAFKDDGLFVGWVTLTGGLRLESSESLPQLPHPRGLETMIWGFVSSGLKAIKVCSN